MFGAGGFGNLLTDSMYFRTSASAGSNAHGKYSFMSQLAKGRAASFDEAKATAEAELAALMRWIQDGTIWWKSPSIS
jgi:Tfp pilus assembly protein PilV